MKDWNHHYELVQVLNEHSHPFTSLQESHYIITKDDPHAEEPLLILWAGESRGGEILVLDSCGHAALMTREEYGGARHVKSKKHSYQIVYLEDDKFKVTDQKYESVSVFKAQTKFEGWAQTLKVYGEGDKAKLVDY